MLHHLVGQQQDRLQAELARAEVEEVLQTRAQQLHHHYIVVTFGPTPLNGWDSHCWEVEEDINKYKYKYKHM